MMGIPTVKAQLTHVAEPGPVTTSTAPVLVLDGVAVMLESRGTSVPPAPELRSSGVGAVPCSTLLSELLLNAFSSSRVALVPTLTEREVCCTPSVMLAAELTLKVEPRMSTEVFMRLTVRLPEAASSEAVRSPLGHRVEVGVEGCSLFDNVQLNAWLN